MLRDGRSGSTATSTSTADASGGSSSSTAGAGLESIAACESGGDPSAIGGGGQYRGKYQFDRQTWQSIGGSGDPAAASEAEQDRRAATLVAQQGKSAWPNCGG
ncbi:MAG: transglycosylase family protein [Thermoleophilaceae bacterium]